MKGLLIISIIVGISLFIAVLCTIIVIIKELKKDSMPLPQSSNIPTHIRTYKPQTAYEQLLLQPEWKEKRLHIIRRDGHRCQYCGATDNLQVHHKYYLQYPNHTRPKPWEYPDTALITLCDDCHKKVHDTKQIKSYYTKYGTPY